MSRHLTAVAGTNNTSHAASAPVASHAAAGTDPPDAHDLTAADPITAALDTAAAAPETAIPTTQAATAEKKPATAASLAAASVLQHVTAGFASPAAVVPAYGAVANEIGDSEWSPAMLAAVAAAQRSSQRRRHDIRYSSPSSASQQSCPVASSPKAAQPPSRPSTPQETLSPAQGGIQYIQAYRQSHSRPTDSRSPRNSLSMSPRRLRTDKQVHSPSPSSASSPTASRYRHKHKRRYSQSPGRGRPLFPAPDRHWQPYSRSLATSASASPDATVDARASRHRHHHRQQYSLSPAPTTDSFSVASERHGDRKTRGHGPSASRGRLMDAHPISQSPDRSRLVCSAAKGIRSMHSKNKQHKPSHSKHRHRSKDRHNKDRHSKPRHSKPRHSKHKHSKDKYRRDRHSNRSQHKHSSPPSSSDSPSSARRDRHRHRQQRNASVLSEPMAGRKKYRWRGGKPIPSGLFETNARAAGEHLYANHHLSIQSWMHQGANLGQAWFCGLGLNLACTQCSLRLLPVPSQQQQSRPQCNCLNIQCKSARNSRCGASNQAHLGQQAYWTVYWILLKIDIGMQGY